MAISNLSQAEFRRRLAGLEDVSSGQNEYADDYRDLASDFVLLLAICFNRRQLEATSLWTRIDSAIQKGLAESNGDDLDRMVSSALDHVLASMNVAATQEDALRIQESIAELDRSQRVYFAAYLAKHRYTAIVLGRKKWEERKVDLAAHLKTLDMESEIEDEALLPFAE